MMLDVKKVIRECDDTVSIHFALDAEDKEKYSYIPGQYITLICDINGKEVRRSYSICTAPHEDALAVAVKRVKGGMMSNYLNDSVSEGQQLQVTKPEGKFVVKSDPAKKREHYLVATGSGITPIISMIKDILENEPRSTCYLYYGSRNEDNIIFNQELKELENKYKGQLTVLHTLSNPHQVRAKGLKGIFGMKEVMWKGEVGRIDVPKFINFLETHPPQMAEQEYYLCGAGEMVEMCSRILKEREVDKKRIHLEYFTTPKSSQVSCDTAVAAELVAHIGDDTYEVSVDKGKTVLQALLDQDVKAPYSCASGACSACIAKVIKGSVEMDVRLALDDDEIAEGYILTCQSHPTSADLEVRYNDLEG